MATTTTTTGRVHAGQGKIAKSAQQQREKDAVGHVACMPGNAKEQKTPNDQQTTSKRPASDQQTTSKRQANDQQTTSKRPRNDKQTTSKRGADCGPEEGPPCGPKNDRGSAMRPVAVSPAAAPWRLTSLLRSRTQRAAASVCLRGAMPLRAFRSAGGSRQEALGSLRSACSGPLQRAGACKVCSGLPRFT